MEMAVELTFKFEDKSKETELGTFFKNMGFEPVDKADIENINQLHDSLVALLPNHEKEILAFTKPDDFGYDVYDGLLDGIEYVYLQKAKCIINICGGSNSMEDTQRFMKFIKTIGGKPLTCKVQSDELEGIEAVKYTMDRNGNITENIVEDSDW